MKRNKELQVELNGESFYIWARQEVKQIESGTWYQATHIDYSVGFTDEADRNESRTTALAILGRQWNTEQEALTHANEYWNDAEIAYEVLRSVFGEQQ